MWFPFAQTPAAGTPVPVPVDATPLTNLPANPMPDVSGTPFQMPGNMQVEMLPQAHTLTALQSGVLGLYFLICLALVVCVTLQTSKSEGLMQASITAAPQTGRGKMTGDERLSSLTSNLAYTFLIMSAVVAYVLKSAYTQ